MSQELIVNSSPHETRLAILENDRLVELYIEQMSQHALAGSIFKGRVTRVLPGMQSAFVDIGLPRDAFLYVSDFFEENKDLDSQTTNLNPRKDIQDQLDDEMTESNGDFIASSSEMTLSGNGEPIDTKNSLNLVSKDHKEKRGDRFRRRRRNTRSQQRENVDRADSHNQRSSSQTNGDQKTPRGNKFVVLPGESLAKYSQPTVKTRTADIETDTKTHQEGNSNDLKDDATNVQEDSSTDKELLNQDRSDSSEVVDSVVETAQTAPVETSTPKRLKSIFSFSKYFFGTDEKTSEVNPEASVQGSETDTEDSATGTDRLDHNEMNQSTQLGRSRFGRRRGRRGRRRSREGNSSTERTATHNNRRVNESPKIDDLLKKGQEILVQVSKEPMGKKGARITSHIALPGRFLIYMPTVNHTGVSRKISSDKERARLRKAVQAHSDEMVGGFIVRTAGEGVTKEDLHADMSFLHNLWVDIRAKSTHSSSASLVHQDNDVVERVLRDRLGGKFKTIWVDSEEEYERVLRFVERFQPTLLRSVKLYTRSEPIFDSFKISNEIEKGLRPKVWLKSGGYIVINPTEALVSIDVNTGKYVGKSDRLEDTIVNTNLEAVREIVRQLRVRDLGGIIIIDFIDMEERSNRQKVMAALEKELRSDIAPSKVLPFNEFGIVAITRKRIKQSLERSLCTPCPYCQGASYVKSVQSVIYEILADARKRGAPKDPKKGVTLRVNPEVAQELKSQKNSYLQELEQILQANVLVSSDISLHRYHFNIQ
ncbi:MAG: ribonuclease [Solibacterales bacterium]|nr:ribonuclease [Bryobacterales bacterium]|tara:strand:- start:13477 stop:15774 length:2298 start_codon:yes stop_codon:yes gene_type:complete